MTDYGGPVTLKTANRAAEASKFGEVAFELGHGVARRRLYSSWLRLTRWEFWPPWASYLPVVIYILG